MTRLHSAMPERDQLERNRLVSPVTTNQERNYPYDCWWVAAFSDEIGRALSPVWLLDMPIVLYRLEDGRVAAIEDRCPHRSAPLSIGTLKGDQVVCGYHGFEFASDGRCSRIPTQASAPSSVRVRSYPVIESYPFIWIYTGDLDRIGEVPKPPQFEWAVDPVFVTGKGQRQIAANYMLLKENVLDLTHFGYVHAKSLKITDWVDPPKVEVAGDTVTFRRNFLPAPVPEIFSEALGLPPGKLMQQENFGSCVSPAIHVGAVQYHDPEGNDTDKVYTFWICHAATPIDTSNMRYWYFYGRNYGIDDASMAELGRITNTAFDEDVVVIEAIQRVMSRDPRPSESLEISVATDVAGIQARRALKRWMARERQ